MKGKLHTFQWQGHNRLGEKQKGLLLAENVLQGKQKLLQQGFHKVKLQKNWSLRAKATPAEICAIFTQLAVLLNSAVSLKSALQILQQDCHNLAIYGWLEQLILALQAGFSFSQALNQQGKYLTAQEQQLIKVGEMTGQMAPLCLQIALHKQQQLQMRQKIQKILLYPSLVLGISLSLTLLLLIFVVPQFSAMYGDNLQDLPFFTAVLLQISTFLRTKATYLISLGIIFYVLWYFFGARVKKYQQKIQHHFPAVGQIYALARIVNFAQSLALMLQAGVPLNFALQSFLDNKQSEDRPFQQEIQRILHFIGQGYAFSFAMRGSFLPLQAQQMLYIGEKSGNLADILQKIADNYREKLNDKIDVFSQLLEPFLMLIIGGLIGLIMLGMYLPIFNMGSMIQ